MAVQRDYFRLSNDDAPMAYLNPMFEKLSMRLDPVNLDPGKPKSKARFLK